MPLHPAARPALWAALIGTAVLCPPAHATPEPDCWAEASEISPAPSEAWGPQEPGINAFRRSPEGIEVCVLADGVMPFDEHGPRPDWMRPGDHLILATRTPRRRYTLAVARTSEGFDHAWFVNGAARRLDERARMWRDVMLEVAAGYEAIRRLRAEEARLRHLVTEPGPQALAGHSCPEGAFQPSLSNGLEARTETSAPPGEREACRLPAEPERTGAEREHPLSALDVEHTVRELEARMGPHLRRLHALQRRMR